MKEQEYAKNSFDTVAEHYDTLDFFKTAAKHIVDIIHKTPSSTHLEILDLACGTGNVVLEAARVLKNANFDAYDISEGMLQKARANAAAENIHNITFYLQDITQLHTIKKYHYITCSYALFFLPDAHMILETLKNFLHTNGKIIFTSFLPNAFSPSNDILLPLLKKYDSASAKAYDTDKWQNLKRVEDIHKLCALANIENITVTEKAIRYDMHLDAWWELLNNTGYKGMLMELSDPNYKCLKEAYFTAMHMHANEKGEVELIADSYFVELTL